MQAGLFLSIADAAELFEALRSIGTEAGASGDGLVASVLVNRVEYAHAEAAGERKLRASWKRRLGGGAIPLVLFADAPGGGGEVVVLGPQPDGPLRRVDAAALCDLVYRTREMSALAAVRAVAEELERLDVNSAMPPQDSYVLGEDQSIEDVLAVEAELLRSEGIDPAWPGFDSSPRKKRSKTS